MRALVLSICAVLLFQMATVGQTQGRKGPPPAASSNARTTPVGITPPFSNLRLRDLGRNPRGNGQGWIDEASIQRGQDATVAWMLALNDADQIVAGKKIGGSWARVAFDCARKSVRVEGLALVGEAGFSQPYLPSGATAMTSVQRNTPPEAAMRAVCSPPAASQIARTDMILHFAAFREGRLARAPSPAVVPVPQTTQAVTALRPVQPPVPTGRLSLVDMTVETDKYGGFFQEYLNRQADGNFGTDVWTLRIKRNVIDMTQVVGRPFAWSADWWHWVADCEQGKLTIPHSAIVAPDGQIAPYPRAGRPNQVSARLPIDGTELSLPNLPGALQIYERMCGDAMLSSIKSGFLPAKFTSATAAIAAALASQTIPAGKRPRALGCLALAQEVNRLGAIQRDQWHGLSVSAKMTTLGSMIREMLGGEVPVAEITSAKSQWITLIRQAEAAKSGKVLSAPLNRCLAELPLGLELDQFTDRSW